MGIKDLQELKNQSSKEKERKKIFSRHLVFGDDIYAFEMFFKLVERFGEGEVALLSPRPVNFQSKSDLLPMGPSEIRGEDNIGALQDQFPSARVNVYKAPSLFFKEGSLREFGGRSKSEKLLKGESFYTQAKAELVSENEYVELFECLKNENILEQIKKNLTHDIPLRLYSQTPEDIVENAHWRLEAGSGKDYLCEHLYWVDSPTRFLDLYEKKNELSDELIEEIEKTHACSTLFYRVEIAGKTGQRESSVFLPLSYTHEWGHFIGDFKEIDHEDKTRADFLSFVEKEHSTEEEISKKFRLFKKNLEKIYPEIRQNIEREWIVLSEKNSCQNLDAKVLKLTRQNKLNMSFVGPNAPLGEFDIENERYKYSSKNLSHLVRGLMSIRS